MSKFPGRFQHIRTRNQTNPSNITLPRSPPPHNPSSPNQLHISKMATNPRLLLHKPRLLPNLLLPLNHLHPLRLPPQPPTTRKTLRKRPKPHTRKTKLPWQNQFHQTSRRRGKTGKQPLHHAKPRPNFNLPLHSHPTRTVPIPSKPEKVSKNCGKLPGTAPDRLSNLRSRPQLQPAIQPAQRPLLRLSPNQRHRHSHLLDRTRPPHRQTPPILSPGRNV